MHTLYDGLFDSVNRKTTVVFMLDFMKKRCIIFVVGILVVVEFLAFITVVIVAVKAYKWAKKNPQDTFWWE